MANDASFERFKVFYVIDIKLSLVILCSRRLASSDAQLVWAADRNIIFEVFATALVVRFWWLRRSRFGHSLLILDELFPGSKHRQRIEQTLQLVFDIARFVTTFVRKLNT